MTSSLVALKLITYYRLSFRIVPIFLSLLVSLPFLLRIVPGGNPCFFSNVPTVQSDLVLLITNHLSLNTLKRSPKNITYSNNNTCSYF